MRWSVKCLAWGNHSVNRGYCPLDRGEGNNTVVSSILSQVHKLRKKIGMWIWPPNPVPLSLRKYCDLDFSVFVPNLPNSRQLPQRTFGKNGGLKTCMLFCSSPKFYLNNSEERYLKRKKSIGLEKVKRQSCKQ